MNSSTVSFFGAMVRSVAAGDVPDGAGAGLQFSVRGGYVSSAPFPTATSLANCPGPDSFDCGGVESRHTGLLGLPAKPTGFYLSSDSGGTGEVCERLDSRCSDRPAVSISILRCRWPLARLSARRARWVSCPTIRRTIERGLHNRRSADGTHSTPAACVAGFPRQPERRRERSRTDHPQGWFRQPNNRLNPVRAVSTAARSVVNVSRFQFWRRGSDRPTEERNNAT